MKTWSLRRLTIYRPVDLSLNPWGTHSHASPYKFEKKKSWMPALKYDISASSLLLPGLHLLHPRSWWSWDWYSCCREARTSAKAKETKNGTYLCNTIIKILHHSLYNQLLIYLRILSQGRVPLILEVGKKFLRIPCRHPLYFTLFNIYFCCIRVHS